MNFERPLTALMQLSKIKRGGILRPKNSDLGNGFGAESFLENEVPATKNVVKDVVTNNAVFSVGEG